MSFTTCSASFLAHVELFLIFVPWSLRWVENERLYANLLDHGENRMFPVSIYGPDLGE